MSDVQWLPDREFWSATRAEHAFVGNFELIAFDLPAMTLSPHEIGFEVFGPPDHRTLMATGAAATFEEAKSAAEAALRSVQ
jgi:hypothetical protein